MRFHAGSAAATALAFALIGCFDGTFEPAWPDDGTVMATAFSPDQVAEAMLISATQRGHYRFEIRDSESGATLAQTAISAPLGYHEHIVSIRWAPDSRHSQATIDYDFGDNSLQFGLSY